MNCNELLDPETLLRPIPLTHCKRDKTNQQTPTKIMPSLKELANRAIDKVNRRTRNRERMENGKSLSTLEDVESFTEQELYAYIKYTDGVTVEVVTRLNDDRMERFQISQSEALRKLDRGSEIDVDVHISTRYNSVIIG